MTLEEKLGQLTMVSADRAVTGPYISLTYMEDVKSGGVGSILNLWGREATRAAQKTAVDETRLGIPLLLCNDVIHGHRTIFPVNLAEACAFDLSLWEKTARAAAREAADDGLHLTFAPMLDVCRDPRWGRIVEGPGEDAFVGAAMARAKTRGFQGDDLARAGRVAATAKHFCAYGGAQGGRDYASVDVSDRELEEVFLPPFAACIEAGVAAIMPAFHDLAGAPMTAHPMLDATLRKRWGFDGVLISDYTAIAEMIKHGVAADLVEAAALAINAGVDIDMMSGAYLRGLPRALARGMVAMETIDACVARVLALKERLGLFDDPYRRARALQAKDFAAHRALAREAGARSTTLLTNRGVLPLAPDVARIALIGPLADRAHDMMGPWSLAGDGASSTTFLAGLREALPGAAIDCAQGAPLIEDDLSGLGEALALAKAADVVILCVGEPAEWSGEAASRTRLGLPGRQRDLVEATLALGKPTVVVLSSGRPLDVAWLVDKADAIIASWWLGHEAGHALADVLTGAREPGGRLAVSWPWDVGQIPVFFGQRPTGRPMDPDQHFTSKYIDAPNAPLFAFGHGLGYTEFAFEAPKASAATLAPGESVVVEARVKNIGARRGETTAFLFARDPLASVARPALELKGFAKIALAAGARGTARFEVKAEDFMFPGAVLTPRFEPGLIELFVGPSADPARLQRTTIELIASKRRATRKASTQRRR
jgi:beta-glucosidase